MFAGDLSIKDGHIKDPTKGLHLLMKTTSTITIPPRMKCLQSTALVGKVCSSNDICDVIDAISEQVKSTNQCGKLKHICSNHKYICVGTWVPRFARGINKQH